MTSHPNQASLFDALVLLRGVLWRPWLVVGVTAIGTIAAVLIAWMLPPVYQSSARILVEGQQIPDALAQPTSTASAAERLAIIEQRLMTRSNLLDISHRLKLFDGRRDLSPADRVQILRDSTRIESTSFNPDPRFRGPTQASSFTISFESDDALRASHVANALVEMVLEQNGAARSAQVSETHAFFCHSVQMRGLKAVISIATQVGIPQVICHDNDEVGFVCLACRPHERSRKRKGTEHQSPLEEPVHLEP